MGSVSVRKRQFEYPDDTDVCWTPRVPEFACVANAISLAMPYLEPYVVRSVSKGADEARLADRGLVELEATTRDYLGQETQHHIQHRRYNEFLFQKYGLLKKLANAQKRLFGWMGRSRSVEYNLAQAATFEVFAYSVARWVSANSGSIFRGADPVVSDLFRWHLAEEVEHKSVVHDVWRAFEGRKRKYWLAGLATVVISGVFVIAGAVIMAGYERRLYRPITWFRLVRWAFSFAFEMFPTLVVSALPSFHPEQLIDPDAVRNWLLEMDLPEASESTVSS